MTGLRLRMWRSPAKWLFVPLLAFSFWVIESLRHSGFPVWSELAPGFMYGVLVMGPIAAGLAGLRAWMERRESLRELTAGAVRSPVTLHSVSILADAGWVIGAYVIAIGVTVARVGVDAAWGTPDVGGLGAAVAGVAACAAIGWAAGWWIPSRLTGPVTGVGLYVAMGIAISMGGNHAGLGALVPTAAPTGLRPMETLGEWTGWLQFGWFVGLAVLLTGATVIVASRRQGIAMVMAGLVVAVGCAVPLASGEHSRQLDPEAPRTCVTVDGIEVCTHPAYGEAIGPMAEAVAATLRPAVTAGLAATTVIDVAYRPSETATTFSPDPDMNVVAHDAASNLINFGPVAASASSSAALMTAGSPEMVSRCPVDADMEVIRAVDFLGRWLVVHAGYMPTQSIHPPPETPERFHHESQRAAFDRFSQLDDAEQLAWLKEHFDDVAACRVEIGDIP